MEQEPSNVVHFFEESFNSKDKYLDKLKSSAITKEAKEKLEDKINNINSFYSLMENFFRGERGNQIRSFLNLYAINGDDDKGVGENKVSLISIHLSKGLEFKHVFVVGMNNGFLPSYGNLADEEERRLAYVAFTRAKDYLYLTSASTRTIYGNRQETKESSYLYEAKVLKKEFGDEKPIFISSRDAVPPERSSFKVNDIVKHKKFGLGTVTAITKQGNKSFLTVNFPSDGVERKLLDKAVTQARD
jgi:DNA helicase-2/ATP-dependent DNA helicase PcrA